LVVSIPTAPTKNFERFPEAFSKEVMTMAGEIHARPIWGVPTLAPGSRGRCFVLMPFKEPFSEIYQDHIKPTIERLGVSCFRADDLNTTNAIMTDVWNGINNCSFLIAELTGRNSNVMYELGIAHTLGKEVILICQDSNDVPFDFRHLRYYRYDFTPRGCRKLMDSLRKAASELQRSPWD
jgi:hypothetical protein